MQLIGETVFNNFRKCQQGRKRKTVVVGHVPMQDAKKDHQRFIMDCGYRRRSVAGLKTPLAGGKNQNLVSKK
jgi:hypothetical protein